MKNETFLESIPLSECILKIFNIILNADQRITGKQIRITGKIPNSRLTYVLSRLNGLKLIQCLPSDPSTGSSYHEPQFDQIISRYSQNAFYRFNPEFIAQIFIKTYLYKFGTTYEWAEGSITHKTFVSLKELIRITQKSMEQHKAIRWYFYKGEIRNLSFDPIFQYTLPKEVKNART